MTETPPSSAFPATCRPVWLASYPRSGNTFLRLILQTIFRLPTYSIDRVEGQASLSPKAQSLVTTPNLPIDWRQRLSGEPAAKLTLIKTHGPPEPSGQAIYVVRDGRPAIDSYFHYYQDFIADKVTLTELIAGACAFGSWSEHYRAWQPRTRPNTLFLRYEDLVARPEEAIPQLARFLGVEPHGGRLPTFAELNQHSPTFFRRGQNRDFLTEWTPAQMDLFNCLHGPTMQELGYPLVRATESVGPIALELARSAARLHQRYLEQGQFAADLNATLNRERQQAREQLAQKEEMLTALLQSPYIKTGLALGLVPPPSH